jgi:hypothetical protein
MADKEVEVQDTDDYKVSKTGRKIRAHRIIFNKGDDDGKKGITEMKKTYKAFVEQHTAELTEEQKNEIVAELEEALNGDLSAGEWIRDFVHSDNPKFEGKSKDKRKQMALAAYYAKQRNEGIEMEEELKGNQHKLDKNKNGKVDKHDFKLLRKEDAEQVDEAQSHQSKTTMKYVSNPTAGEKKAAKDIKPGIAGYRDRVAMLKSAEARGALKKEETMNESADYHEKMADQHANHANQHEKEASNDGHPDHDYASLAHENAEKAHNAAAAAHKKHGADSSEYKKAAEHAKTATSNAKDESGHLRFRKVSKPAAIKESVFDWKNKPRQTSDSGKTKTYHDVKKVSTGTVYTKQFDKDGVSKGTGEDAAKKAEGAAKRGRGRPKKDKFAEAVEFLLALSEEHFDDMMEEGFDTFLESYEQLDELSKATLGSYTKKATTDVSHRSYDQGSDDEMGSPRSKRNDRKLGNRVKGIGKAVDRLTK